MDLFEEVYRRTTEHFAIIGEVASEDMAPEDQFENQEDIDAIREGRILWFCVRVRVVTLDAEGEIDQTIGRDFLGGCAYANCSDFFKSEGYFPDMVRSACHEARQTLAAMPTLRKPR